MNKLLTRCVHAAGAVAAILLDQICYWHPRMTVKKRHKMWIAKTREEWGRETGLTFEQIKDSLRTLRIQGLIETGQFIFARKPILHLRLTEAGVAVLAGTTYSNVAAGGTSPKNSVIPMNYKSYPKKDKTALVPSAGSGEAQEEEDSGEGKETPPTPPPLPDQIAVNCTEKSVMTKGASPLYKTASGGSDVMEDGMTTVQEVMATQKLKPVIPIKLTKGGLALAWRKLLAEKWGGAFVAGPTQQELGQWGRILKAIPLNLIIPTLTKVADNWGSFGQYVMHAEGTTKAPDFPNVGYLTKHISHAVMFMQGGVSPPVKQLVKKQVQPKSQAPAVSKPVHAKATMEEIQASIAQDQILKGTG